MFRFFTESTWLLWYSTCWDIMLRERPSCWEKGHMTQFSKPLLGDTHLLTLATGWCLKHRTPHFLFFMILVMKQSLSKVNESYSSWSICHPYCFYFPTAVIFPTWGLKQKTVDILKNTCNHRWIPRCYRPGETGCFGRYRAIGPEDVRRFDYWRLAATPIRCSTCSITREVRCFLR